MKKYLLCLSVLLGTLQTISAAAPLQQEDLVKAIHEAAQDCDIDRVGELLDQGVQIDAADEKGFTLLMAAVEGNCIEIVEFLLANGANVDAQDNDNTTALMWAALLGRTQIVEHLLEANADRNVRNKYNNTAAIIAAKWMHDDIFTMIRNYTPRSETKSASKR